MGIASTLKGSKKQVSNLGNDNSLQSSLSKSSESQRNNSFNSRKIVGNLAMKLQKKTTDVVGTIAQTNTSIYSNKPSSKTNINVVNKKVILEKKHISAQSPVIKKFTPPMLLKPQKINKSFKSTTTSPKNILQKRQISLKKEVKPSEGLKIKEEQTSSNNQNLPIDEYQTKITISKSPASGSSKKAKKSGSKRDKLHIKIPENTANKELLNIPIDENTKDQSEQDVENKRAASHYLLHSNDQLFIEDLLRASPSKNTEQPKKDSSESPLIDLGLNNLNFSFVGCVDVESCSSKSS